MPESDDRNTCSTKNNSAASYMYNFVFHNPTKVLFGTGMLGQLGSETAALGKKVLLVSGMNSLKANGVHAEIQTQLQNAGLTVLDFPGASPNPCLSHVHEGIAIAQRHHVEVIIAAGGGSVIDTGKAIAAGTPATHDVWKFFIGKKGVKTTLPVIAVPTLAASGSDMNAGMVLTNKDTGEKLGFGHRLLHPSVSILDPALTFTVPADYTVYGAVDAFTHMLEFYLSREEENAPVQMRLMEGLMENALEACNRCLINGSDYNARADLMWTCSLALSGLTAAGLGRVEFPVHCIEHALSGTYDFPHGAGLAALLPGYLSCMSRESSVITQRLAQLQARLSPLHIQGLAPSHPTASDFIQAFERWCGNCGISTKLSDMGAGKEDIQTLVQAARKQAKMWRLKKLTPEVVTAVLHESIS